MCVSCENLPWTTLNISQNIYVVNKEFTLDNLHSSTLNAKSKYDLYPLLYSKNLENYENDDYITQDHQSEC